MSYVIASPEMMTSAATDLATIGSDLSEAHLVAAAPTVALVPAAADEVSAAVTHLFSQHAAGYQAVAAQAAAFQGQFVQHLTAGAFSYAGIEAAIASFLHTLTADVNGFFSTLAALPSKELASIGASYLSGTPYAPDLKTAFVSTLAALPPQQAILILLTAPLSIPIYFGFFDYFYTLASIGGLP